MAGVCLLPPLCRTAASLQEDRCAGEARPLGTGGNRTGGPYPARRTDQLQICCTVDRYIATGCTATTGRPCLARFGNPYTSSRTDKFEDRVCTKDGRPDLPDVGLWEGMEGKAAAAVETGGGGISNPRWHILAIRVGGEEGGGVEWDMEYKGRPGRSFYPSNLQPRRPA